MTVLKYWDTSSSTYKTLTGPMGPTGATGLTGPTGPTGQGVPVGGSAGQVLSKNSATDYDTSWANDVASFNTRTGAVTLTTADVTGAGGAPIASPTFTGTPTLPTGTVGVTQTAGTNNTSLATTAFVATTVGAYLPLAGGTLTGALTLAPVGTAPQMLLNKSASGQANIVYGQTAALNRWGLILGNATAEGSGNVGSDLVVQRMDNTGTFIDSPLTITRSTGQVAIKGTNTNDSAAAGFVGEYISSVLSSGSAVTWTSSTAVNVTSISLTPGDWDVSGEVWINIGTGGATLINIGTSVTSGALLGQPNSSSSRALLVTAFTASQTQIVPLAPSRQSLSATTTVYLVGYANFPSGTVTAYGRIGARRVR